MFHVKRIGVQCTCLVLSARSVYIFKCFARCFAVDEAERLNFLTQKLW